MQGLVPLAMSLMLDMDETEAEWASAPYTEEPADENHAVGEEVLIHTVHVLSTYSTYFSYCDTSNCGLYTETLRCAFKYAFFKICIV